MNTDKLEVLQEMYSLCIQNRKEEKKKIQTNLDRISEIDAYIKSIKESEEADFKIFSPRSSESIYGDRIRKAEEEKEEIENGGYKWIMLRRSCTSPTTGIMMV